MEIIDRSLTGSNRDKTEVIGQSFEIDLTGLDDGQVVYIGDLQKDVYFDKFILIKLEETDATLIEFMFYSSDTDSLKLLDEGIVPVTGAGVQVDSHNVNSLGNGLYTGVKNGEDNSYDPIYFKVTGDTTKGKYILLASGIEFNPYD